MTYGITIGKKKIEGGYEYVAAEENDRAPQFDKDAVTGKSNNREISYGYVRKFFERAGLDLYMDREGSYPLTTEEYLYLTGKLITYKKEHPDAIPGWAEGQDDILGRLEWMKWWMYYALGKYGKQARIHFN